MKLTLKHRVILLLILAIETIMAGKHKAQRLIDSTSFGKLLASLFYHWFLETCKSIWMTSVWGVLLKLFISYDFFLFVRKEKAEEMFKHYRKEESTLQWFHYWERSVRSYKQFKHQNLSINLNSIGILILRKVQE